LLKLFSAVDVETGKFYGLARKKEKILAGRIISRLV
jgi:hypothetical protein